MMMCFLFATLPAAALAASSDLPYPIADFYDAIISKNTHQALEFFSNDAMYVHTTEVTAHGHGDISNLLVKVVNSHTTAITQTALIDHTTTGTASSVAVARTSQPRDYRDVFWLEGEKIKAIWTTKANSQQSGCAAMNQDPPAPGSVLKVNGDGMQEGDAEAAHNAIELYFCGFGTAQVGDIMRQAYRNDAIFMADFDSDRVQGTASLAPLDGTGGQGCDTLGFWTGVGQENSIAAQGFNNFVQGNVNLNRDDSDMTLYGDMAIMTSTSNGCEGDHVTPDGNPPMPNRELYVLVRTGTQWKIKLYTFSYDPAVPPTTKAPVDKCFASDAHVQPASVCNRYKLAAVPVMV